jgi:hypothetical protein
MYFELFHTVSLYSKIFKTMITEKETLLNLQGLYRAQIKTAQEKLESVNSLLELLDDVPNASININTNTKPFDIPLVFDADKLSQREQVYFSLRNIGSGFVTDVVNEWIRLGAKLSPDVCFARATYFLSEFKRHGHIDYQKQGKKFKYKIS